MPLATIFCSSSPRTSAAYLAEAATLGRGLVAAGWRIRTGAGREGCMGALTEAALAAGGAVEGVILRLFLEQGLAHEGLAGMVVADSMRERKRLLGEGADVFVALPGGPGTWEELWELAVERQIGVHQRPLLLINAEDFYDGFLLQLRRAADEGLLYGPAEALFQVVPDAARALDLLRRR